MTVRDAIREDTVAVKWVRTAATTITAVAAAGAVLWGVAVWVLEPHAIDWTERVVGKVTSELSGELNETKRSVNELNKTVISLGATVVKLEETRREELSPSWSWDANVTSISDGAIGGTVTITAAGYKHRDCGIPVVDIYFRNGDNVYHRFSEVTLLSSDQRGIALPAMPGVLQKIVYRATIPSDDDVTAGRAVGSIAVTYPEGCPVLPASVVRNLQFRIFE